MNKIIFPAGTDVSHACSYLKDRTSTVNAFRCDIRLEEVVIDQLMKSGYRRCGDVFYRNVCSGCSECRTFRIILSEFKPNRTQKRNLKANAGMHYVISEPSPTAEKENMYLKYFKSRHLDETSSEFKNDSQILDMMYDQMYTNFGNTIEFEFYHGEKLAGFSIVDTGAESLSAVYTVFDPDLDKMGIGKYAILNMIEFGTAVGKKYLYLGFYIENHDKMSYKSEYRVSEILINGEWRRFDD